MPKKLKLALKDLKVQSFVTSFDEKEKARVKGAGATDFCTFYTECDPVCQSQFTCDCEPHGPSQHNTCRPSVCTGVLCCY